MIEFHERLLNLQHKVIEEGCNSATVLLFNQLLLSYYALYRRSFPWRDHIDPYHVVVSEVMLQQTQTQRVEKKFSPFIQRFPSFESLAFAPLSDLLLEWSGLGYNRRAIALQKIAQKVVEQHNGILPSSAETLQTFPGIGKATASSIVAFAYNSPTIFIETNIRAVFIHCFFATQEKVHDNEIEVLVQQALDIARPRDWYYSLMDLGVFIKSLYPNPSRKSLHHIKQSKFEGSNRQLRSTILKTVLQLKVCSLNDILQRIPKRELDIEKNIYDLVKEGFLKHENEMFFIQ